MESTAKYCEFVVVDSLGFDVGSFTNEIDAMEYADAFQVLRNVTVQVVRKKEFEKMRRNKL